MEIELQLETPAGNISRSAMEKMALCPRARFWAYELWRDMPVSLPDGSTAIHCGGLSSAKASAALLTGGAVHEGFASLLKALQQWEAIGALIPWREMRASKSWHVQIDVAVQVALNFFDHEALEKGISFGLDPGSAEWYAQEQRALVEGLVWVAGLRLVPELISRYRIVDVEREERMELGPGLRQFAARADALLAERDSGDLSVFSLKTGALYGKREEMKFKRDVQGLSEAIAIERRLHQEHFAQWIGKDEFPTQMIDGKPFIGDTPPPKIETVQMALLLKGLRRMNEKAGRKEHYSPLTRAWRFKDPLNSLEQWAWSYDTPKTNAKTGESYMGKLGKDFSVAPSWEYPGGVRAWVLALDHGEIQSELGDALAQCMAVPEPWGRSEEELVDWLDQAQHQERKIQDGAEAVNAALGAGNLDQARRQLNFSFPQNRSSCVAFNSSCQFDALCWGGQGLVSIASGMAPEGLILRRDHHSEEPDGDD